MIHVAGGEGWTVSIFYATYLVDDKQGSQLHRRNGFRSGNVRFPFSAKFDNTFLFK
jgi:hypothetical protein